MEDININTEDIEKFQVVCDGALVILMCVGAATVVLGAIKVGKSIGRAALWNHDRKIRKQMQMNDQTPITGL